MLLLVVMRALEVLVEVKIEDVVVAWTEDGAVVVAC